MRMTERNAVVAALAVVVVGCSTGGQPVPGSAPPGTGTSAAVPVVASFDPPRAFGTVGVPLQGMGTTLMSKPDVPPPVVLSGTTAYIADVDHVQAVDTRSGSVITTVAPKAPATPLDTSNIAGGLPTPGPPVLIAAGGKTLVGVPFVVTLPGQGTTPSRTAVQVSALDTTTNATVWTATLPPPAGVGADSAYGSVTASLVGTQGDTVVLSVTDGDHARVDALDASTGQGRWSKDDMHGQAVTGDVVVGITQPAGTGSQQVTAVSVGDGSPRWSVPNLSAASVSTAGPALVELDAHDYGTGHPIFQLLSAATGAVAASVNPPPAGSIQPVLHCRYDGTSVTVCASASTTDGAALGLDAATGHVLWQLPDTTTNRVAPAVTTVWHGAVYGTTTNGPVVLDATTGADREAAPGIAPDVVDTTTGIAYDDARRSFAAYPATH